MPRLGIGGKVLVVVFLLVLVSIAAGITGAVTLGSYRNVAHQMEATARTATLGERVNGLIFAVVMDSRGIYMSAAPAEAEKFAAPLLKNLDRLRTTLAEWRESSGNSRQAQFSSAFQAGEEFVQFRTELVRLAREKTLAEARLYGDNDANRKNRSALNDAVRALAETDAQEVSRLRTELDLDYASELRFLFGVLALGLTLGISAAIWVVRGKIVGPIKKTTDIMRRLAGGELAITVPFIGWHDEIGTMAAAVQVFKANALEAKHLREAEEAYWAKLEDDKAKALQSMAETVEQESTKAVDRVTGETTRLEQNAAEMGTSAETMNHHAQSVAKEAAETLANVQSAVAAAERLTTSISEIARQIGSSTTVTAEAVGRARDAEQTIVHLADSMSKIDAIVQLIRAIATQTNLLALNATIEAARAGEAGKGFAVVASEVKNLAGQTSKATEDITAQISGIQGATGNAVKAVEAIAGTIRNLEGIASSIATAIGEQRDAATEISVSISQTSGSARVMSTHVADVSHEAEATGRRAMEISSVAATLAETIQALKRGLVQVVRTSTREVDRRIHERYDVDRPGAVDMGTGPITVRIADCSARGAMFSGAPSGLRPGQKIKLSITGVGDGLRAVVKAVDGDRCQVEFESEVASDGFGHHLAKNAARG